MKDNLYLRQILAFVLYIIFFILRFNIDFNIRFPLLVIYTVPLMYYILYVDDIPIINMENIMFFILSVLYFVIIIIFYIPQNMSGKISPIVYQAAIEELFFRFCMLGIAKKYISFNSPLSLWLVLLVNSMLFAFSHTVYNSIQIISLIQLGVIYGLIYLTVGIGPTIISHALWNLNHNIFFVYPIFIPASILAIYSLIKQIARTRIDTNVRLTKSSHGSK